MRPLPGAFRGGCEWSLNGAMRTIPLGVFACARAWAALVLVGPCAMAALSHRYDAAGRLGWSVQPGGQATHFSYDAAGNITAVATVLPAQDTGGDGLPDTWEVRFSPSEVARGAGNDPDGDGVIDPQEFAFARLPDRPDGGGLTPVSIETGAGGSRLTLRYLRPIQGMVTLAYIAEVSTDLRTWSSAAADVESLAPVGQGGGLELVAVRAKVAVPDAAKQFLRVRIVKR